MSDRSVVVRLRAVTSDYTAAMRRAGQTTTQVAKGIGDESKKLARGLDDVSGEATIAGAALLGIGVAAVAASTNFDKSMSKVAAVSGASATQLDRLRQSALDAGASTVFSATEAAEAQAELAKAGIATADILGGALTGSLALAAAGGIGLADSATIAAQAMNQFKLEGKDVGTIADVLAAGANKSAADVAQLGQALQQGGLVASQTGLSLEETVAALSAFADRALIGSDAGTSLKTMLQRLTPQSDEAAAAMESLGIAAFDASGEFVGLPALAEQLRVSLGRLTPEQRNSALATIFGSDAVRGATVLYELGAQGVNEYTEAVSEQGAAADTAAKLLDNLSGDLEALRGALETSLIQSGSTANGVLRESVQLATGAVTAFGKLPAPVLGAGLAVTAAAGGFLLLAPRVAQSVDAFKRLADASPRTATAIGKVGKAAGVATVALLALQAAGALYNSTVEDIVNSGQGTNELQKQLLLVASGGEIAGLGFQELTGETKDFNEALNNAIDRGWYSEVDKFILSLGGVDSQLARSEQAVDGVDQALAALVASGQIDQAKAAFDRLQDSFVQNGGDAEAFKGQFNDYRDALAGVDLAAGGAAGSNSQLAIGIDAANDAAKAATDAIDDLEDALALLRGDAQSVDAANADLEASFDDAREAVKDLNKGLSKGQDAWKNHRKELDLSTPAGRKAKDALDGIADSLFEKVIPAYAKAGKPIEDVQQATMDARAAFIEAAKKAGLNGEAAEAMADKYGLIPKKVTTTYAASGVDAAVASADAVADAINAIPTSRKVTVTLTTRGYITTGQGQSTRPGTADGGFVYGPGTARSDSILQPVSNGEFVTQAAVAQANRPLMTAINDGRFADAAAYLAAGGHTGAGGLTIGSIEVLSGPGERAEESIPRSLRREAFLNGLGG